MYIAIEGCLGAGKSTVARGLAECRNSQLVLENFEVNPFLSSFYADPVANATETEFAFLLLHYHQLKSHVALAREAELVADFHLGKDLIYAELNLADARSKGLFRELYEFCLDGTPQPGLIVFLSADTDLLLERIRWRQREYELAIDPAYYAKVNDAYEEFFRQYSGKKLRLSMSEWDFVKDPTLYTRLSLLVDRELNFSG